MVSSVSSETSSYDFTTKHGNHSGSDNTNVTDGTTAPANDAHGATSSESDDSVNSIGMTHGHGDGSSDALLLLEEQELDQQITTQLDTSDANKSATNNSATDLVAASTGVDTSMFQNFTTTSSTTNGVSPIEFRG
ncbi:MAG: hypothetical protein HY860_04115 [Chlamydiales bacterium]|nr:hypothetical protein [Chlamydiales bacterium]